MHGSPQRQEDASGARFRGFDGLRAMAILGVVLWHGAIATRFPDPAMGALRPLVRMGWAGVDLFFALSGFLITALILREERNRAADGQTSGFSLARFYARRALRILPVFYAVFALNTFLLAGSPSFQSVGAAAVTAHHSPCGLVPYATFWGNYFTAYVRRLTGLRYTDPGQAYIVYWSLCVEEHFYLAWPLFLAIVRRWRDRVATAAALCIGIGVLRYVVLARGWEPSSAVHTATHYRLDAILWGALGALLQDRLARFTNHRRLALGLAVGLIALLVARGDLSVIPEGTPLGMSLGLSLLAVAATLAIADLAHGPRSRAARWLEARPLVSLGRVSYGMYLVHFQAIDLGCRLFFAVPRAPTLGNLLLSSALFAILAFCAAWILYRVVEAPFLRLKAQLTRR